MFVISSNPMPARPRGNRGHCSSKSLTNHHNYKLIFSCLEFELAPLRSHPSSLPVSLPS